MADVKPVALKKQKKKCDKHTTTCGKICVVHNCNLKNFGEFRNLTNNSWATIKEAATQRQLAKSESQKQLMICEKIPDELELTAHGYHRCCYASFTNLKYIRKRKSCTQNTDTEEMCSVGKRMKATTPSTSKVLFPEQCIICEKKHKYLKGVWE